MTETRSPVALAKPAAAPAAGADPARRPRTRRQSTTITFVRTAIPLVLAVAALSLYSNSRNPEFLTWNNYDNILSQVSVLGILAAGQTFLIIGGQLDLSVGSMVSFVAVVAATLFDDGWSTPAVLAVCLGMSTAVGVLYGLIVAYLRVPPFILTLGGLSVFASAALILSDNHPISVLSGLETLGFGEWHGVRAPALTLLLVLVATGLLLHFTRFGRNTFALGSSPQASFFAGLPSRRLTVELFALNGVLTGLAGLVMMARLASGDPHSGEGLELNTIAVTVLGGAALAGGRGNMIGTFLGTMVYGTVSAALTFLQVPGAYQSLVSGGILIFAVLATAAADLRAGRVATGAGLGGAVSGVLGRVLTRPGRSSAARTDAGADPG
ncbi:ribose transport system permease protein/putative xylitol transport system permease protein [Jatrophihabitans endophyticus]|uniref:Ribose transport system permease protein/putative xylitol transport system permease protein n=1 Tax=Jatrophihabitans endophyticus TaxID=1206085 RepID=A0A1M5P7S2_9ACTN|nr:ABC transporter permease [Jatrophihabitans endophyticus]SHG97802.1 ribose transport system permease protein/putative xylitol transport system permease protein [Jatrophihabitans endophyticus]